MEVLTKSAQQTQKLGKKFANQLKGGEVIALRGLLGSGKTTFVQGLAKGLGVGKSVISPTFVLMREHPSRLGGKLYHIDLYRLEEDAESELKSFGFEEFGGKDRNIVVIEWAEKAKSVLPKGTIWIDFEDMGGDKRHITIKQ